MSYKLQGEPEKIKDSYPTFDVKENPETGVLHLILKRADQLNTMNLE